MIDFGYSRRCINPSVPVSLAGYFNKRMWKKILDDIEVRALVITQKGKTGAILHFDLVSVSQHLYDAFFKAFKPVAGLNHNNIILSATHTHTAPEVRCGKPGSSSEYIEFAAKMAAEALTEAASSMRKGEIVSGQAFDNRFCFNRRYWMKSGVVVTNPGKLNPDIVRPEGEVDYEIPMMGITEKGKLKVLLANIVNHSDTIGGSDVSADWDGFFRRSVEAELGDGSLVMPIVGCAGNINHFDVSTDMNQTSYAEAERVGKGYAETVKKALENLKPVKRFELKISNVPVEVPPRKLTKTEIDGAKAVLAKYADIPDLDDSADFTSEDLAQGRPAVLKFFARMLLNMADEEVPFLFNLIAFSFGDVVITSLPAEPFVEIGLETKYRVFSDKTVLVATHCNTGHPRGGGGYIPNCHNYNRGGYECTPRSSPFDTAASEMILWGMRKLAGELEK